MALITLAGCAREPTLLEQVRSRGVLRVVTLNAPTTYYLGSDGPEGYEYRLTGAFARTLGVQLVIQQARDTQAMRAALESGSADLAAAQITASDDWKRIGYPTAAYADVAQLVVQQRSRSRQANIAALKGARVVVRSGSPQLQLLDAIRANGAPYLSWTELPREQADPLDWVTSNDADYAIVDAGEYGFLRNLYPDTAVAFTLPDPRPAQWIVRRGDVTLRDAANDFIAMARNSGLLAQVERAATPAAVTMDYESARQFQVDMVQRLPMLQPLFESAAQASGIDWRLLAAIGYQESRWNNDAQSANGARGVMMLTPGAARTVGVTNRTDTGQNILGGARYLIEVIDMIPERIAQPDRLWFALAAYNVGYGHLEDARVLTQTRGGDPDRWDDVRMQLPLLAQQPFYSQLKRGYARGWEPAAFVEQVRQFLSVLQWADTDSLALQPQTGCHARTVSSATGCEELPEQGGAVPVQHPAKDVHAVVQPG